MSEDEEAGQAVTILVDGEGKFEWTKHFRMREGKITHLAALPGGMVGGRASVMVLGKLKDGSYALLQTSLRVMLSAFAQWQAVYGIEADGKGTPPPNAATRERLNAALLLKLVKDREGQEATFNIDELNAVMQDPSQDIEVAYGPDGKTMTIRTKRSD